MKTSTRQNPVEALPAGTAAADGGLRRIGAVARMLRMPVATLRVWEQRYGLTQARLSTSGQRLYSDDDVHRLALIKQLTAQGHAIGSVARLDMAQLQHVAATHASTLSAARSQSATASNGRSWRLAVVGAALGVRLRQPGLLRQLDRPVQLLGPFDDLAEATAALQHTQAHALLVHAPQLHPGWVASFEAASPALAALPKAVLYGFAPDSVCEPLTNAGIALLREPQPDVVIGQWLAHLSRTSPAESTTQPPSPTALPPRRWDDAALVEFAMQSTTVACECPRHIAELLVQLGHFERYSAECGQQSPADAELHAHLQRVAATSRAHFEDALERVAHREGLPLPTLLRS